MSGRAAGRRAPGICRRLLASELNRLGPRLFAAGSRMRAVGGKVAAHERERRSSERAVSGAVSLYLCGLAPHTHLVGPHEHPPCVANATSRLRRCTPMSAGAERGCTQSNSCLHLERSEADWSKGRRVGNNERVANKKQ